MVAPPNLALGVLIMLFHMILDETILAICVMSLYVQSIKLLLTVMQTWMGSSF
jgi:hypothetical protein